MDKIIVYAILILITIITVILLMLQKEIEHLNKKIDNKENKIRKSFKRNHSNINPVNFSNPIQARKNLYDEYKNEKGLYEPVTPRKGIKIEEDK